MENDTVKEVCVIKDNDGNPLRLFQILSFPGYNDHITVLAEFRLSEDKLKGIKILEHHETPNYGAYAAQEWFLKRFAGKSVAKDLKVVKLAAKEPEEIVCLTGATITTVSIVEGVNKGLAAYRSYRDQY